MSNVLIGIIGVILFIGLALAGALFLGPRFQESSITSRASAYVGGLKQIADAATLYQTQTGTTFDTEVAVDPQILVAAGYLKANPNSSFRMFNWADAPKGIAFYALPQSADSDRICEAVQRQTGQISSGQPANLTGTTNIYSYTPAISTGCIRNGTSGTSPLTIFVRY